MCPSPIFLSGFHGLMTVKFVKYLQNQMMPPVWGGELGD